MRKVFIVVFGHVSFVLLFIAAMNITGMITRAFGLSRTLDDVLTAGGILLAAIGSGVFMRTLWRREPSS